MRALLPANPDDLQELVKHIPPPTGDTFPAVATMTRQPNDRVMGAMVTALTFDQIDVAAVGDWPKGTLHILGSIPLDGSHESRAYFRLWGSVPLVPYTAQLIIPSGRAAAQVTWSDDGIQGKLDVDSGDWTNADRDEASRALRWLESLRPDRGRPKGTGHYPDEAAFRSAFEPAVRLLRGNDRKPTRNGVAEMVGINSDHLRDLCRELLQMTWSQFVASVK